MSFKRVSRSRPCPICGRPDWCLVAADGSAAICPRTEEGSLRHVGEAGYLHRLADEDYCVPHVRTRTTRTIPIRQSTHDFAKLVDRFIKSLTTDATSRFADTLGVAAESLRRLRVGWASRMELEQAGTMCRGSGCWTFPMVDASGTFRGIRLRTTNGFKYSVAGSRSSLFVPDDLSRVERLLICEGPTDTAALLDLGFTAVGRPSCTGGTRLLVELVQRKQPREAVVVADNDAPGQRGARALASTLRAYCESVRIITPPKGVRDARAWRQSGVARNEVMRAIEAAPALRLTVRRRPQRSSRTVGSTR